MLGEDLYDIMAAKLDFIGIALMLPAAFLASSLSLFIEAFNVVRKRIPSRPLVLDIHRNEWHAKQQAYERWFSSSVFYINQLHISSSIGHAPLVLSYDRLLQVQV